MRLRSPLLFVLSAVLAVSCAKHAPPPPAAAAQAPQASQSGDQAATASSNAEPVKLDTSTFLDVGLQTTAFHTTAHAKYLSDPMKFSNIPDQGFAQGQTAVVGSNVCMFYPNATLKAAADLDKLTAGVPIPLGTILPIKGDKVAGDINDHDGMFNFQENWNWFYQTTFHGQSGLVFGADLYGLDDTNADNRVTALLYKSGARFDTFYPTSGYHALSAQVAQRLTRDKVALQSVQSSEYGLSADRPDDMVSLYLNDTGNGSDNGPYETPIFVTTDLAAHAQHLMFDRLLQYVEETYFFPRLNTLIGDFLGKLKDREAGAASYRETYDKAVLYLQVAKALLDLAPDRVVQHQEDQPDQVVYQDKDKETVLAAYPQAVRDEITKMDNAEGFEDSSVFTFSGGATMQEDYSQYKPRGHYTKNGILSAYFRAMMWFGRINFLIAEAGAQPLPAAGGQSSDSTDLTLAMEPIALLFTDIVKGDDALYKSWADLFDPITALIGQSDDLSFKDVLPLWSAQNIGDFGGWATSRDKLLAFMQLAHEKLRPPAISGSSVFQGPSEGADHAPPMGWRLFGQRFTYDSSIHERVSPPLLMSRDMVRGLDIMKAFGSRTADLLLQQSDYPKMDGLKDALDTLEKQFSAYDAAFWEQTYYNGVLFQVKSQAQFEPGAGFYFTESPAWGIKAMLSAHGTWAELRHDTILYVKQVYAERAGGGDYEPTFRTLPLPQPFHYLEPNVPFWQGSLTSVEKLLKILDSFGMLDQESADRLGRVREIYAKALSVAQAEAQDQPLAAQDVAWIATIPAELARLVLLHTEGSSNGDMEDADQLKMALVADVFTNAELGEVLETAVGIPYRIYVALNDGQGGKRVAIGYVFDYFEFPHPMNDRMTDEQWKKIAYDPTATLTDYQPFWTKGATLPQDTTK